MSKTNILNFVLFIAVIGLAFFIYSSEEKSTELDRLTKVSSDTITSITINHNKNEINLIKNKNNKWSITKPIAVAANDFRINSLLKLLNAPVHSSYSVDEINLSATGLKDSPTNISLNNTDITFGETNPATNLRYILLNNRVFTIEDVYYPLITSNFGTLVSFNLLPADSNIKKLILKNQTIVKDEQGLWRSNMNISADSINKIIDDWKNCQAFGVHEYLERESLGEIFIYTDNQTSAINYVITDTDPWVILARPDLGIEYHLKVEAYSDLIEPI